MISPLRCIFLMLIPLVSVAQDDRQLSGYVLGQYPWYHSVDAFLSGDTIWISTDPLTVDLEGLNCPVYLCEDKNNAAWNSDPQLIDVRTTGAQMHTFSGNTPGDLAFFLENTADLEGTSGDRSGHRYDVVIDTDASGTLSPEDLIDGYTGAGLFIIADMQLPGLHSVDTALVEITSNILFKVWWPSNIGQMGPQPLVVFSHGWTHHYWYYDSYAEFLASHGYVVMSHKNDVGNGDPQGTETAAQSLLVSLDAFTAAADTIGNGILFGKIDFHDMVWNGHSTGGESIVRAYTRLVNNEYISPNFTASDVTLLNSFAPVAWMNEGQVNPGTVNYHQFLGGADTDASGEPIDNYSVPASIYERGSGNKQLTYIHGAGHEDFHDIYSTDTWPDQLASGPDLIGKEAVHTVVKPYLLALCERYAWNNEAMTEFFTRHHDAFRPQGIDPAVHISSEFYPASTLPGFTIDDFQNNESTDLSSSGIDVSNSLASLHEIEMRDDDETFDWDGMQYSNGMVRARFTDDPRCAVLEWNADASLVYMLDGMNNWSDYDQLTLRACQVTRHPLNPSQSDLFFDVTLTDAFGHSGTLSSSTAGPVHPPYARGWGGYGAFCLNPGTYTVVLDGSNYNSEMSFDIPGFLSGGSGNYDLVIPPGNDCTNIEIFGYDSYGDGWDQGQLVLTDSLDAEVGIVDLLGGSSPDTGHGWQNEFYSLAFRLTDFTVGGNDLDLSNITELRFDVGLSHGSATGAMAIDDLRLGEGQPSLGIMEGAAHPPWTAICVPNPASDQCTLMVNKAGGGPWSWKLTDAQGRLIAQRSKITGDSSSLPVCDLPTGLYFVSVAQQDASTCTRLIVE